MKELLSSPLFTVMISLAAYEIGYLIRRKTGISLLNPLLTGIALIIALLTGLNITYGDYSRGGNIITFFLAPATVSLAVPLFRMFRLLKKNAFPILLGIFCGSLAGVVSVILLAKLFGLTEELAISLIPKSVTTPIGMAISEKMGGFPPITVVAIIITGITGSIIGPLLHRLVNLNDRVAMGVAMGCCSHAIGTAKAMELGETEGAMSGLTIALAGLITVLLAPPLWTVLG
jgi:predicted murein hydrolase (TIGR00659 family)